jgi:dTDP-4-amino-4,6-dideoxygalactose transaminase
VSSSRVYMSVPHMSGNEQRYVREAFETNWLSSVGPNLDAFEAEIERRLGGAVHALGVVSGSAALHLVLRYAGVGPGDRVAVQSATFAGSVFPILYQQARPVFIDSEPTSGNIDPALVQQYLHDAARTNTLPKVLIAVHLYGQHADLDPIAEACAEHGVTLIEDAAESLGSTYKGRETATTAPLSILSFNGNKIITTTGGGMCVAKDPAAIPVLRKWSTQSKEPTLEYEHRELGYNYRMSNVLAGIGRGQLEVLDQRVRERRAVAQRYMDGLADLPGVQMQAEAPWGLHTRWLSVLTIDPRRQSATPVDVITALAAHDVESRPVWRPMHTQPMLEHFEKVGGTVSETFFAESLCLPSSSSLAPEAQDRVTELLRTQFSR